MACTMKDQIKCGDGGAETFTIFHEKKPEDSRMGGTGSGGFEGHLVLRCQGCAGRLSLLLPVCELRASS